MHFLSHAVSTAPGLEDRLVEKAGQVIDVRVGPKNNVAAPAAVSAVGTASRDEFLTAEAN